ncbi:hypothetical protein EDC04DRAFT_2610895 [Pisolithus marmoratus]|nr:hypothetical protein EDC04DRAFT_2610895 [Pisolithus marmoratus]
MCGGDFWLNITTADNKLLGCFIVEEKKDLEASAPFSQPVPILENGIEGTESRIRSTLTYKCGMALRSVATLGSGQNNVEYANPFFAPVPYKYPLSSPSGFSPRGREHIGRQEGIRRMRQKPGIFDYPYCSLPQHSNMPASALYEVSFRVELVANPELLNRVDESGETTGKHQAHPVMYRPAIGRYTRRKNYDDTSGPTPMPTYATLSSTAMSTALLERTPFAISGAGIHVDDDNEWDKWLGMCLKWIGITIHFRQINRLQKALLDGLMGIPQTWLFMQRDLHDR